YPFVFSFANDHFQYLTSLGLIELGADGADALARRHPQSRIVVAFAYTVALAALGAKTFAQGHVYRDLETLYRHVLRHNPHSWMAHNNLGGVLRLEKREAQATPHFERSL